MQRFFSAASQNRDPAFFESQTSWTPALQRTASRRATRCAASGARDLPPELPHQRQRGVAEQLLDGRRVQLIDALELAGVDAAGDEQAVDAETMRAREIGAD